MSLAAALQRVYPGAYGRRRAALLLEEIAGEWGYTVEEVTSPCRERGLVACRRAAVTELRNIGMSWPELGKLLNRDPSSVMYLARTESPTT